MRDAAEVVGILLVLAGCAALTVAAALVAALLGVAVGGILSIAVGAVLVVAANRGATPPPADGEAGQ